MKHVFGLFATTIVLCLMAVGRAEETSLAALKEQRATLTTERKETESKLQKRRQELAKANEMATVNADVSKARKALDKALADDPDLKAARAKLADARKGLDAAIAGASDGSDEAKALDIQRGELETKRAALHFQSRLLDLQLNHSSSPARVEAEVDPVVKKARKAQADSETDLREKPVAVVAAATREVGAARQNETDLWQKLVAGSRELKSANEDEKSVHETLRKARSADSRQVDLTAARRTLEDVKAEAFKASALAKPLLAEIAKIEKEVVAVDSDRRAAGQMLDMFRDKIRDGKDRDVSKVRDSLADAEKAFDAVCPAETKELGLARKAAWNAYEAKREEVRKAQEDKDLAAKREAAEKDVEQLREKMMAGKSVFREMATALRTRADIDQKLREQGKERESKEVQAQLDEVNKLRGVFSGAKAQHLARIEAVPAVKQASDAVDSARKVFSATVESCLTSSEETQPVRSLIDDLSSLRRGQDYRLAVLRFRLYDAMSPIAQSVAQQPDVAAAAAKVSEIEKTIREKPQDSISAVEKAASEARARREKCENELRMDPAHAKAVQVRLAAAKALAEAQAADPRGKAVADARGAVDRLVAEKIRTVPTGAAIVSTMEKVQKEIQAAEQAIRGVVTKKDELRRAVEKGENPKVAVAKKAVSEGEAAVKAADQSEKITMLRKAVAAACSAQDARLKDLESKDKECLKLVGDLGVSAEVEKVLAEKIRAMERAVQDQTGKSVSLAPAK